MKKTPLCTILLSMLLGAFLPTFLPAATAKQGNVDCVICCRATTGGSSNCRMDIEHCSANWEYTCPSGLKVYCGYFEWNFVACREDTRPFYEECWEYTGQTCENAMPISALDHVCDQSYIDMQCLENMPE